MRGAVSVILGFPAFVFFVLLPAKANYTASLTKVTQLTLESQYNLERLALNSDPCNPQILEMMGDAAIYSSHFDAADWAYGEGVRCAPNRAVLHFKHGYALIQHKKEAEGRAAINRALEMEPANLVFKELLTRK